MQNKPKKKKALRKDRSKNNIKQCKINIKPPNPYKISCFPLGLKKLKLIEEIFTLQKRISLTKSQRKEKPLFITIVEKKNIKKYCLHRSIMKDRKENIKKRNPGFTKNN